MFYICSVNYVYNIFCKNKDNNTCQKYFYKTSDSKNLHAHHIVPASMDGEDSEDNLIILCANCHRFASKP